VNLIHMRSHSARIKFVLTCPHQLYHGSVQSEQELLYDLTYGHVKLFTHLHTNSFNDRGVQTDTRLTLFVTDDSFPLNNDVLSSDVTFPSTM